MICNECGAQVIYDPRHDEYVCSGCGLVYEEVHVVESYQVSSSRNVSVGERSLKSILSYVDYYSDGMPTCVKERARYIASKGARLLGPRLRHEAFAVACVRSAAKEYDVEFSCDIPRNMRRFVNRYSSAIKKIGLCTTSTPRERCLEEIRGLCQEFELDFGRCLQIYTHFETLLSGRKPSTAARVVCFTEAIISGRDDVARTIYDDSTMRVRKALREIPRKIIREMMQSVAVAAAKS